MARFLLRPLHFACLGIVAAPLLLLAPRTLMVPMARGATPLAPHPAHPKLPSPPLGAPAHVAPAPAVALPGPPNPGVVRDDGMVSIESDRQQADNRTGIVTAIGNVRITYPQKGMVATSRQAQYFSKEGRLVLSGDVDVVDRDGQRIRAERLVYLLDSERVVAEPSAGRQVHSRLRLQTHEGAAPSPLLP
ncbi:MAG: LPS-assembly protein LptD [Cyanobacteria bacterium]|nr:LPS-assembly protein LptD [Cyanobacteriota bacterium]